MGIGMVNSIIGLISICIEFIKTGTVSILGMVVVGIAVAVPYIFHSSSVVFNFDRESFNKAVEDSARGLLIDSPEWIQNKTAVKSKDATLHLSLWVTLFKVGFLLYTYDKSSSKKLELYKQLLAKQFHRALPRLKIKL